MRKVENCRCLFLLAMTLPGVSLAFGASTQKMIVADFEDFGTWRMCASRGLKVQAWWPASVGLGGSDADQKHGDLVGEMTFAFDPESPGPFFAGFERAKMSRTSGFLDGMEWEAKANRGPVSLSFQIQDAAHRIFTTIPVPLTGEGWCSYRIDFNASTVPGFAECRFPARLKRITLEATSAGEGRVFLDDLTLTGRFAKEDQLCVTPVYEKISFQPEEEIVLRYRVRNGLPQETKGLLRAAVRDFEGRDVFSGDAAFSVQAGGEEEASVFVGRLPRGAYEVALTANAAQSEWKFQDHFVVMVPNAGRPNRRPMWFGIADQTSWQSSLENRRHWEWMRLLGIDINRLELFADQFEPAEGVVNESGWRDFIRGHSESGIDVLLLYSTTPKWTHSHWKWRRPPDLWDKFEAHARRLAGFLRGFPTVRYVEFWNEPDLTFFEGTLDEYLAAFRHFSKAFREMHPGLPLATGGVTVQHPQEKAGFSQGMFQQGAPFYDVAAYHSHGPLINAETRHRQVEKWLREGGVDGKRLINTESGDRSLNSPEGRRKQAVTLVKKIVFSKSQRRFDAYFWFTLQDYWDLDPEADDSFGLVTSDNRAKPSFAAYNTLIRQLANAEPMPQPPREEDGVALHAFRRDDGSHVYAGWPVESRQNAVLWVRTAQKVRVSDMFGETREHEPLGGFVPVTIDGLPFYLSTTHPGGMILFCAPAEGFLQVEGEARQFEAKGAVEIPVRLQNPSGDRLSGELVLRDSAGRSLAERKFRIEAAEHLDWVPRVVPDEVPPDGKLRLTFTAGGREFSFPVSLIESRRIPRVGHLSGDPATWPSLTDQPAMKLDRPGQVFELAYDPNTPAWQGPQDLSAAARMVHDGKGLRLQITVTDDVAGAVQPTDRLWLGDGVQVAIGRAKAGKYAVVDLGLSGDGARVWCSDHEDSSRLGPWAVPVLLERKGLITTYDVYLPFALLGISPEDRNLRFSFLVNENDGRGRVRWMEWTPGIGRDRSLENLSYAQLE